MWRLNMLDNASIVCLLPEWADVYMLIKWRLKIFLRECNIILTMQCATVKGGSMDQ